MVVKEHLPVGFAFLFFGEEDLPENQQKLKNLLNEMYWRIKEADQKVILLLEVLEKVNNIQKKLSSALVPLEVSLLKDALKKNVDIISEVVTDFTKKTKTYRGKLIKEIPSCYKNLFVKNPKTLEEMGEKFSKDYEEAKSFLFPNFNRESDNIEKENFEKLAATIIKKTELISKYRNKVSCHLYAKKRHLIFFEKKEYVNLVNYFLKVLESIAIVATYSEIDSNLKLSDEEILRTKKGFVSLIKSRKFKKSLLFKRKGIWSKIYQFLQSVMLRK